MNGKWWINVDREIENERKRGKQENEEREGNEKNGEKGKRKMKRGK